MLRTRALTAVVGLTLFLSAMFFLPKSGWVAFCAAILAVAAWEWGGLAGFGTPGRSAYSALLVATFVLPGFLEIASQDGLQMPVDAYYASAFFWMILVPAWLWRRPRVGAALMLAVGAVVLVPAFAALVDLHGTAGPVQLLAILAIVWISDSAAYLLGSAFGKHKLAPSISPGKSWEGVLAALVAVIIYALAWAGIGGAEGLPGRPGRLPAGEGWFVAALIGLAVVGMIGDLFESLLKRQAGVKDSGTLLPGHGGMLDRIDAPMAMLPFAVLAFIR
jgi:phosphatidate cytidylyltransferase